MKKRFFERGVVTRIRRAGFLAIAMVLLLAHQAAACVGCREPGADTVANEPQTVLAGFGFSWGVLIMLGFALSIVGGLVVYIWRRVVQLEAEQRGSWPGTRG